MSDLFPVEYERPDAPKPTLLVDTREQTPLVFSRLPSEVRGLATGDYSIAGLSTRFAIERKSVSDFVACCMGENRVRFEAELVRMRGYDFRRLLIVGCPAEIDTQRYRSRISPRAVWATLFAFDARYCLPYSFAFSPESAASQVEQWAVWYHRERVKELEELR